MTALLEFKQKIKYFFGQYEIYIMPVVKFIVAFLFFRWINANLGYMTQLNNDLLLAVLSLICCILPPVVTVIAGFGLICMHCYALSLETAGFMLVLILLLAIFFLRFSQGTSIVFALTPISFAFGIPVMLPVGSGLLCSAASSLPAGCGVILYYFIRFISGQAQTLANPELELVDKLQLMADGIVRNWGMWITVVAFILVILLVSMIRTRAFDYAWQVAIVVGGAAYIVVMMVGSYYLSATVDVTYMVISTVIAVVIGLVLEFFFFGGDYSRTERLQYEDDDYFYYVKAVPKAHVATSERSIKKIDSEPSRERVKREAAGPSYANPIFQADQNESVDLEKKLEESLRDL